MIDQKKIHIIGAGFSGLSLAYLLSKTKLFQISVFEKSPTVGGMLQSQIEKGTVIEKAANSILCNDQVLQFLNEIEADILRPLPTAKKRYFFRNKMTSWPLHFFETLCFVPRLFFHVVTQMKYLKMVPHQSVYEWSRKYFGSAFTNYILSPGLQGIYATSAENLDTEIVLGPTLNKSKKGKYQGIVAGRRGMVDIISALEKKCVENGVQIHVNQSYVFDESNTLVIVCTSAAQAVKTIASKYPLLAEKIKKIKMNHVLSVTCQIQGLSNRPKGFGCLIPRDQNISCLGVLFNSDIFEGRNSETYIFSGEQAERLNSHSTAELKNEIFDIRKKLFNVSENIETLEKFYWPQGLPIYNHGLADFQNQLQLPKNLYLHGNYISGIGLSKLVANSYELSEKIVKDNQ